MAQDAAEKSKAVSDPFTDYVKEFVIDLPMLRQVLTHLVMDRAEQNNKLFVDEGKLYDAYLQLAQSDLFLPKLAEIYSKRFTEEEMSAIISFRHSAAAKKEMALSMETGAEVLSQIYAMVETMVAQYPDKAPDAGVIEETPSSMSDEDAVWKEIQDSELPVVIKVSSNSCPPCKILAPIFESLFEDYEGICQFMEVNVERAPSFVQKYKISALPTVLILKDGEVIDRHIGLTTREQLVAKLDKCLSVSKS